jgi:hypothetical protein
MTRQRTLFSRLRGAAETLASATRVAAAVEARRKPPVSDLRRLGIDPHAFTSIGHG